ncbi:unnamed protein product [Nesidiocoris tenuis]|uniref:Uncharacterized protein n=1 Tax=Nesidiocoris tenuis TaxID=355587 RepID=A0A6H5HRC6_9HEMI|nr:unnamed protein product [Nesidiocoris tenuis]
MKQKFKLEVKLIMKQKLKLTMKQENQTHNRTRSQTHNETETQTLNRNRSQTHNETKTQIHRLISRFLLVQFLHCGLPKKGSDEIVQLHLASHAQDKLGVPDRSLIDSTMQIRLRSVPTEKYKRTVVNGKLDLVVRYFLEHTSLHGFRFIAERERHWSESRQISTRTAPALWTAGAGLRWNCVTAHRISPRRHYPSARITISSLFTEKRMSKLPIFFNFHAASSQRTRNSHSAVGRF